MKRSVLIIWISAAVITGCGWLALNLNRVETREHLGWKIERALANHDARGLADLLDPNMLEMIGVDKPHAIALIEAFTMPVADEFTANLSRVSTGGSYVFFEKTPSDPLYITAPTIDLPKYGDHYILTLNDLMSASWNIHHLHMIADGNTQKDFVAWLTPQFAKARSMGLTKAVNRETHEVYEIPIIPYTSPKRAQ